MREVFIGSSREGLKYAEKLCELLDARLETYGLKCTLWKDEGVFLLGKATIESLCRKAADLAKHEGYAIMLVTPDDRVEVRGEFKFLPRDNVVFELGLFLGHLGRERTFCVAPSNGNLRMLSDWAGVTNATFRYVKRPRRDAIEGYLERAIRSIMQAIDAVERPKVVKDTFKPIVMRRTTDEQPIVSNIIQEIEQNMEAN